MKFPKKCPHCGAKWFGDDEPFRSYLFVRTDLDFDSDSDAGRIEDQIYECSECHTLFRARWELVSFVELVEKFAEPIKKTPLKALKEANKRNKTV